MKMQNKMLIIVNIVYIGNVNVDYKEQVCIND